MTKKKAADCCYNQQQIIRCAFAGKNEKVNKVPLSPEMRHRLESTIVCVLASRGELSYWYLKILVEERQRQRECLARLRPVSSYIIDNLVFEECVINLERGEYLSREGGNVKYKI